LKSTLVRLIGFPATLIHGDTLVLDRWLWLKENLPHVCSGSKTLLEIGCGSGAFTIGAARLGYRALGLSWDKRNQAVARERARICNVDLAEFRILDIRNLDESSELRERFDVVLCCETIEHILNDAKLMVDMSNCLVPGGTLLLTSPNYSYKPITSGDEGPFSPVENGGHVRRGYTTESLCELCVPAGLKVAKIGFCSGLLSQKTTKLLRTISKFHPLAGWVVTLPLRPFLPILDPPASRLLKRPGFSITLVATKPKLAPSR
jgi:SAM-dependent methyltransferase